MAKVSLIERRGATVARLLIELNHSLYERLEEYVEKYGMSKRDIVAEALLIWLNTQDEKSKGVS